MSKMVECPHCGHDESHVYLSKRLRKGGYRRHECFGCGERFTSLQNVITRPLPKRKPRPRKPHPLAGLAQKILQSAT